MKKRICIALLLAFILSFALLAVTACSKSEDTETASESGDRKIPVYQGMTISKQKIPTLNLTGMSYRSGSGIMPLSLSSDNNNGNHNGHYKGDHTDRNDIIDGENPYPENEADETIEQEIESSLNVVGSPATLYYATPNEDIYINIHIDNPDSFEILSFTLNGKKYSGYMFEDGSDMETIILKYNVGNSAGIVEYTIDAIKYVDGTEIKDVIIEGNKTVKAGVKTENQVAAGVTSVVIDTNALSFNVNLKDPYALVEFSGGALKAVLYDGSGIVAEQDVALGDNAVTFEGLATNTLYQYAIVGYYDNLSGEGFGMNLLHKEAFYTDSVVLFDRIVIGQESVDFGFLWHEDHQGKAISSMKLYAGETLVKEVPANASGVTELLSDTTYQLVAEYPNAEQTESISIEFTTLAKTVPDISVHTPTKTQTSLGFAVTETDPDNVGTVTKIELVHASGTVLAESPDQRSFTNLLSNNTYTVRVTYVYNLNDGTGAKTVVKELVIKTDAKAEPDISVHTPTKTQTSLGFAVTETDPDNVGTITKIELLHGSDTPVVAENTDVRNFTELLSNNTYTVKVTYVYNLNDGTGAKTVVKELVIKTDAKAEPELSVHTPTKTQTAVGFTVTETDPDNVGTITKIELVHASGTVLAESPDQRSFAELLSNNTYTVRVTYVYNLNDGTGDQTVTRTLEIRTDAKTVPSFAVKNERVTKDSLDADYEITDADRILNGYKVELYRGETLVLENVEKEISFAALNYYTDYTVRITYTYDLNDGNGLQETVFEKTYKTLPYIDGTECNVANTVGVSKGETIFLSVNLDNPLGMTVESVMVNGKTYPVTTASTKNEIFVEIVYDEQFVGGDTCLKIELFNALLDETSYALEPVTELSDNVFINGKLEVVKVEYVNEDFEPIEWAFPSETVHVLITLSNPTGYAVDRINDSAVSLTKLDDNRYYFTPSLDSGNNSFSLTKLNYHNEYVSKSLSYGDKTCTCYQVVSDTPVSVSTPEDLKNMAGGCYYVLTRDIDLAGIEWQGSDFNGVLEGNGYAIKNLSFEGTVKNSSASFGLFSTGTGVIQNLKLEGATVLAEVTADDGKSYDVSLGGFVANASSLAVRNCSVDEHSAFNVKNETKGTNRIGGLVGYANGIVTITSSTNSGAVSATCAGYVRVGGLVGYANGIVTITSSTNSGAVSTASGAIGGLVGYATGGRVTIKNSINSGAVSGENNIGGLVGYAYSSSVTIANSTNLGTVSGTGGQIGGMVGYAYGGSVAITNSINVGDVCGTHGDISGMVGWTRATTTITNSYTIKKYNTTDVLCTVEQLNTPSFYTDTLGWSEEIWDLSDLDVANGKYPKLK